MAKNYGLHIIIGDNGMGKTFYTHIVKIYNIWSRLGEKLFWFKSKRKKVRIGNYTSPDFDIIYRSRDDLVKVIQRIIGTKTNPKNEYIDYEIVCDEVHKYFSNRDFKNFPQDVTDFLSEVRKQDTTFYGLSPRMLLIDTVLRRMSYTIMQFCRILFFFRYVKTYKLIREDSSVLEDETVAEKISTIPLVPIWIISYFLRLYTKYTRRYDSKEIIFTKISILHMYPDEYLDSLFPDPIYIKTSDEAYEFTKQKVLSFEKPKEEKKK